MVGSVWKTWPDTSSSPQATPSDNWQRLVGWLPLARCWINSLVYHKYISLSWEWRSCSTRWTQQVVYRWFSRGGAVRLRLLVCIKQAKFQHCANKEWAGCGPSSVKTRYTTTRMQRKAPSWTPSILKHVIQVLEILGPVAWKHTCWGNQGTVT